MEEGDIQKDGLTKQKERIKKGKKYLSVKNGTNYDAYKENRYKDKKVVLKENKKNLVGGNSAWRKTEDSLKL